MKKGDRVRVKSTVTCFGSKTGKIVEQFTFGTYPFRVKFDRRYVSRSSPVEDTVFAAWELERI